MKDGLARLLRCALLLVLGCGLASEGAAAVAQTALKVTLDGRIDGPSAPVFVAWERGYFKAQDLEVSIEPSAGGPEPFARVSSGAFDIGIGDINAMMRYRDQNANGGSLRAVFIVHNRPGYAIIGRKSRGIIEPSNLDGKKLGAPALEPASAAWPAFAKLNGIEVGRVMLVGIGLPVREPMLAAGEVDAVTGTLGGTPIVLRERGVPFEDVTVMRMSEYGLAMYGTAVFVSVKTLAEKPDAVRAFLRAYLSGLEDTARDPAAAMAPVMRRGIGLNRDIELERLLITIRTSVITPETREQGLGSIDPGRFEQAIDQVAIGFAFKSRPKPDDVFDGSLLPPENERRLDGDVLQRWQNGQ